jgi:hypothetical protein
MDADDYGQRITDAIKRTAVDSNTFINMIKVKFSKDIHPDAMREYLLQINKAFRQLGATNCVFIPIGDRVGVMDVKVNKIEIENYPTNDSVETSDEA